jgi:hypothetical protein
MASLACALRFTWIPAHDTMTTFSSFLFRNHEDPRHKPGTLWIRADVIYAEVGRAAILPERDNYDCPAITLPHAANVTRFTAHGVTVKHGVVVIHARLTPFSLRSHTELL